MEKVESTDQAQILRRVKTIRGHFAAVERMIEEEQPFKEILMQLKAVRSAIHQVAILTAQRYAQTIMDNGQEVNEAIKMLMDLNQSLVCVPLQQGHDAIVRQSNFKNYFFTEGKSFSLSKVAYLQK